MHKERLNQILDVLLLPYYEKDFCDINNDSIANARFALARMRQKVAQGKSYIKIEKKYYSYNAKIQAYFSKQGKVKNSNYDDMQMLVNLFFPEEEIAELYSEFDMDEDNTIYYIDCFYINNIYRIAKSLLTFRDGKIAIRTWVNKDEKGERDIFNYPNVFDKVEVWNLLARKITPDVIIMAFFVESDLEEVKYLYNQTGGIMLADKNLENVLRQGVTENHVHLNATMNYQCMWQSLFNFDNWKNVLAKEENYNKFVQKWNIGFEIIIYRMLWAEYLESNEKMSFDEYICRSYSDNKKSIMDILCDFFKGKNSTYNPEWEDIFNDIIWKWKKYYNISNMQTDSFMDSIYGIYYKYNTHSEMIFLFKSLIAIRRERDIFTVRLFMQYMRIKNHYFSDIVQANGIEGLTNFRLYYGKMGKKQELFELNKKCKLLFKSMSSNIYLKKLEVRMVADIKRDSDAKVGRNTQEVRDVKRRILKSIQVVLEAYKGNIEDIASGYVDDEGQYNWELINDLHADGRICIPVLGIVFHFLKKEYVDNKIGNVCWVNYEENKRGNSKHLIVWRDSMVFFAKRLEELRSEIPLMDKYIVGIDAASEENKAEPWIFAPVYAAIRNKTITKPLIIGDNETINRVNNIGFTYHVGEEFRHLLSGLRHIDEVIQHFNYKPGDRLGHAIALGVDVNWWMEKNEVVVMPVIEHLENLLWIWGNMVYGDWVIEIAVELLEGKILAFAKEIFGETIGMSVQVLYDAYCEKFKKDYKDNFKKMEKYLKVIPDKDNVGKDGMNHFCKYYGIDSAYGVIWTKEKVLCAYFCPLFYQKLNKGIMVHVGKEEYSAIKKIQEYVISEVERKGIYVEANPTSNSSIGEVKGIFDVPVFNLNSKGLEEANDSKREVLITINSDDPLIFNTNSENELSYVYHALIYKGYKMESVLEWIDKVRRMGMESSFIKEEKSPSKQYEEITSLLKSISSWLKEGEDY